MGVVEDPMYPVAPDQESTVANSKAEANGKPPHTT